MAVLSLILSIIALFTCVIPVVGFAFAILALLIAILTMASKKTRGVNEGIKKTSLVMSIISTIISFIILAFLLTGVSVMLDVANGILDSTTMIENNPELAELVGDLYEEYFTMVVFNKFSKDDITVAEAESRYDSVLRYEYSELYMKGYGIDVEEDLSFKIIYPGQSNI